MRTHLFSLFFFSAFLLAHADADYHVYVAGTYNAFPPSSIASYNPSTGKSGPLSLVPSGGSAALGSPDGSEIWIAGGSYTSSPSGFVTVVSASTQKILANLPLGNVNQYCNADCPVAAFDPKSRFFYVVSNGTLSSYSVAALKLESAATLSDVSNTVGAVVSQDGSELYLTDGSQIQVVDLSTKEITASIPLAARSLAAAGSTLLAGGASDLYFIDMATNSQFAAVPIDATPGTISVSADGSKALLSESSALQVVDVPGQSVTATTTTVGYGILSPDGTQVTALGVSVGSAKDVIGRTEIQTLDPSSFDVIQQSGQFADGFAFYAGTTLFVYYIDNIVSIVDGQSEALVAKRPVGSGGVSLLPAPSGKFVYAFTAAGVNEIEANGKAEPGLALSVNTVAVTRGGIYTLYQLLFTEIDPETGQIGKPLTLPSVSDCFDSDGGPTVSPNQQTLVFRRGSLCNGDIANSTDGGGIGIYSTANNDLVSQVVVANTSDGVFSPDSNTVYVPNGTDDGPCQINVVDIASATVTNVWTLPGSCSFNSVAVSPDGTTLWASVIAQPVDAVYSILEVNATTGELINQFPLTASSMALSPDGTNLVFSGGTNGDSVGFLNIATGQTTYLDLGFAVGPLIVVP